MRMRFLVAGLMATVLFGRWAAGDEPYLEFVQGLKTRQYYDLAMAYLVQIDSDPQTPAEIKAIVPYEKGTILLASSRLLRNPDARSKQLDEAQAMFEAFATGSPNHPLSGQANTQRARILLDKARVETYAADEPANEGNQEAFRARARDYIKRAREVFQQAHDQHQAAWEKLKGFIPEEEKQRRQARDDAEALFMQAQLDLGRTIYEEAQTYDRDSKERSEVLNKAATEFEAIHQKYRSQIVGLHARMWQAKCFEEQDEIGKALGIYKEILEHPGRSLNQFQDRVRWFRFICLNHDDRKDFQLVIDEATQWRNDAKARLRTNEGLGIQFELARALESLADQRTTPEATAANLRSQALNHARAINRIAGPLKAVSGAMIQRLMVALNREPGDPRDFDTAFGTANLMLEDVKKLNGEIDAAVAQGNDKLAAQSRETLLASAAEMTRLFDLALKLSDEKTDAEQINLARFRLAYAYFLEQKFLEAGVVADYLARTSMATEPQVAVEAAFVALAAFDRVFDGADQADRDFEMQQVLDVAELITETWPESDRAIEARTVVARIYRQADQPELAAEWFSKIPETAQQYPSAQLSAGQSYWNAYLTKAALPAEERPEAETLLEWKRQAEQYLQRGVEKRQQQVPAEAEIPEELTFGKLSLVQIRNSEGVYQSADGKIGAIELLTSDPHSVLRAVAVEEGQERPADSGEVKSKAIASLAYQQLLRAHIGVRDLEAARTTREQLEAIAGAGEEAGALTQVYVEFGRELQKELEQLAATGDTSRLNEVRDAFEQFLGDLFKRKEGQSFNSLLWIAETFTGLAEGSGDDPSKAEQYYQKAAATYQDMLARASADTEFITDDGQVIGVKLRLVNCRREQGDHQGAEDVLFEVLADRPTALDAQIEAATLYQDWATAGTGDDAEKLQYAIEGRSDPALVWGWGQIAQKLQRAIDFGQGDDTYEAKHIDARYHLAKCLFDLAGEQTSNDEMNQLLTDARLGIQRFVALTPDIPDEQWKQFDSLNGQILEALGEEVRPLTRLAAGPAGEDPAATVAASSDGAAATTNAASSAPSGSSNVGLIVLFVLLGLGAAGGIYFMTVQQDKKRRAKYATAATSTTKPSKSKTKSGR